LRGHGVGEDWAGGGFRLGLRFRFGLRLRFGFWLRLRFGFWLGLRFRLRLGLRFGLRLRLRLGFGFGLRLRFRLGLLHGFRFLRDRRGIDGIGRLSLFRRFAWIGLFGGFRVRDGTLDGIRRRFGLARRGRHEDDGGAEGEEEKDGENAFHGR